MNGGTSWAHAGLAPDEREVADGHELMHGREAADDHFAADDDMTGQGRGVGQDVVVPDHAVMSDMRIGHHQVVRPDAGLAPAAFRAPMYGRKLADLVAVADDQSASPRRGT
jgi:hypothetical protein